MLHIEHSWHVAPRGLMAFFVLLSGCGHGCDRTRASGDGGAAPDAGTDVSRDKGAAEDAGSDVVDATDAPTDLGPAVVDDRGWATPPWLPPGANVTFATDPQRMITPPEWTACRDGRAGCREMLRRETCATFNTYAPRSMTELNHGRRVWFGFGRQEIVTNQDGQRVEYQNYAVMEIDRSVVTAWRIRTQPRNDQDGDVSIYVHEDRLITRVGYDSSADGLSGKYALILGVPGVAPGASAPIRVLDRATDLHGINARFVDASESTMAFSIEQGVAYIPLRTRDPVRVIREPVGALYSDVVVQGDVMFWEAGFAAGAALRSEEWFVRGNEAPRRLLDSGANDLRGFDTDGAMMAWVLGLETVRGPSAFSRSELWVAPYTTDPGAVRGRRLFSFGRSSYVGLHVMQNGYYVAGDGDQPFYIVNLRDGSYWQIDPIPGGMRLLSPAFVSDTEVGFLAYPPDFQCFTMVRIRLDSLGARRPPQTADAGR